jgi:hypothetical protein
MLINLTNHPLHFWTDKQTKEAIKIYASVVDLPFPAISPTASAEELIMLVNEYTNKCIVLLNKSHDKTNAVHIMGEMTFCFALVNALMKNGITCIASTTDRLVEEKENRKTTIFEFIRFREYILI